MVSDTPTVSIGLPVYNGQNYLDAAIRSLREQTFRDIEIVICDNASTDGTAAICAAHAAEDSRIRYYRNEVNLGVAGNFNRCFELSRGVYFKWHAHDDVLEPIFLERCLAGLKAMGKDAVMCHTLVNVIDKDGQSIGIYDSGLRGVDSETQSVRFRSVLLQSQFCMEFFGLMRRETLVGTGLHGSYPRSDDRLLGELALRGRFVKIPFPLFMNREHPHRYMSSASSGLSASKTWFDTSAKTGRMMPTWNLFVDYFRIVGRDGDSAWERTKCYFAILLWVTSRWNLLRLLVDFATLIDPRIFDVARNIKYRLFGRASMAAKLNREADTRPRS